MPHPSLGKPETSFMDKCNIFVQLQHASSRETVKFYGIIDSFADNYQSNWSANQVFGRSDPIATYQNTQRTISISFKVLSEDDDVGSLNMRDISKLVNMLYPTYDGADNRAATLAAGPLLKLKFTNLATNAANQRFAPAADVSEDGLYGYINGAVNVNHVVNAGYLTPKPGIMIPREVNLSINFTVLHTHHLGWTLSGETRTNGYFPYKTGGAFTNQIAQSSNGATRFNEPSSLPRSDSPTTSRDDIPPEIINATTDATFGGTGATILSEDDANSVSVGVEAEQQVEVFSSAETDQGRRDASSDSRNRSQRFSGGSSDTAGRELEEHYDGMIDPENTTS